MAKIKLTPIKDQEALPKNKYQIVLTLMHGDADKFEEIVYDCDDEADFIKVMTALENQPVSGTSGGNDKVYKKWCADNFGDGWIPRNILYDGHLADIERHRGFYWNEYSVKMKAELE